MTAASSMSKSGERKKSSILWNYILAYNAGKSEVQLQVKGTKVHNPRAILSLLKFVSSA